MTVQELIDILLTFPPDAYVMYDGIDKRRDVEKAYNRIDVDSHETFIFLE